jgi:hypothetical protein
MVIPPSQRCESCKGLKRGYIGSQPYIPNNLENLGYKLNSLPCAFNFNANTNIYSLYPLFRESRRMKNGQQQALLMSVLIYMIVLINKSIDICLGIPSTMSNAQTFILCFFCIPFLGMSYLNRPVHNHVMK